MENSGVVIVIDCIKNIGKWIDNYVVVKGKEFITPCIILYNEYNHGENIWGSAGGMKDPEDTDIKDAALRELYEESYIKLTRNDLKGDGHLYKKCRLWIVNINNINRKDFLERRYGSGKLKSCEKELYDMTKVPLINFIRSIDQGTRTTTDILNKKIQIRYSQYMAIKNNRELYDELVSYITRYK